MMKKIWISSLIMILATALLPTLSYAKKQMPQTRTDIFEVDSFEDGNLRYQPKWWTFDGVTLSTIENDNTELVGLGNYSLRIQGDPYEWYIGGLGTLVGIDATPYNAIKLVIFGRGPNSGTIITELYDDDNFNWVAEKHPNHESQTKFDDVFRYTIKVTWVGWKVIMVPFDHFVDANKGIGDDKWNPNQNNGSGGLVQMQLIVMASDKNVAPDLRIDTIKLFDEDKVKIRKKKKPTYDAYSDWW